MEKWKFWFVVLTLITISSVSKELSLDKVLRPDELTMTFLITVNDSWKWVPPIDNGTYECTATIKTSSLFPNTPPNEAEKFTLGNCDNGSLVFTMKTDAQGHSSIVPTFYSTFLPQAYPPTCTIDWNYGYRLPTKVIGPGSASANESLLPWCSAFEQRDGVHTTTYWFHILEWDWVVNAKVGSSDMKIQNHTVTDQSQVANVTFLVAVNQTVGHCIMTEKTNPLQPGVAHNQSEYIHVGKCDFGPLDFKITASEDAKGTNHTYVDLVFISQDIPDAPKVTCRILWDYTYNKYPWASLLPGCYTTESKGQFHTTYYWFYIMDWAFG